MTLQREDSDLRYSLSLSLSLSTSLILLLQIINSELFKNLREVHGEEYLIFMGQKLIPVAGNVREDDLGISPESIDEIAAEVDIIVNSAANTTFDERS